jgi:hypothetical protein
LLTGARKSELRLAKWTCIDLQKASFLSPLVKVAQPHGGFEQKALAVLEQVKLRSEALGLPITRDS